MVHVVHVVERRRRRYVYGGGGTRGREETQGAAGVSCTRSRRGFLVGGSEAGGSEVGGSS